MGPTASRRLILASIILLLFLIFAFLQLTGRGEAFSKVAHEAKSKVQSSIKTIGTSDSGYAKTSQPPPYCKWVFSKYEASAYETEWFSLIDKAQDDICATVYQPHHAENSRKIVRRILSLKNVDEAVQWRIPDSMLPVESHPDDQLFSRMHYTKVCYDSSSHKFLPSPGRGVQLIEPLWGMLRDPFDMWCGKERLVMPEWKGDYAQSKEAIMPQGFAPYAYDEDATKALKIEDQNQYLWRPQGIPPWHSSLMIEQHRDLGMILTKPSNIHLDLGSSYFGNWLIGDATAASGQWFYNTYHKRGQPFDLFMAVELESLNPSEAYNQIPPDLVGTYNLINIGLSMDPGDKLNTMDLIKRKVRPEDFFVFKLDIDHAPIEMPIIEALLADDEASALVDELMFEHHVMYKPMAPGPWLPDDKSTPPLTQTLADSYKVFRDLRIKSIRAHSWP